VGSFQQTDEPEEHPKQPDPFDAKNRRVQEGTAADLQFLRTAGIDPGEKSLLDYFRGRTLPENDRAKIVQMVEQLGSPDFRVREKASDDLVRRGPSVLEFLRKGVTTGDLETTRRAEQCIDRIRRASPSTEVTATAVISFLCARQTRLGLISRVGSIATLRLRASRDAYCISTSPSAVSRSRA